MGTPVTPSISLQLNWIKKVLSDWAVDQGGIAVIAKDIDHMWEIAYETSLVPRCIITYAGEDVRGDFAIAAATSRVDRHFIVLVTRAGGFSADRGKSMSEQVGNARPFTDILEEARDLIRALEFDASVTEAQPTDPVDFKGIKPVTIDGYPIYAYTIEFSIGTQLATIYYNQPTQTPPAAPFHLTASYATTSSAQLEWNIDNFDSTNFVIDRSTDNVNFVDYDNVAGNTTLYVDNGIVLGNTYYYKVAGYNAAGTGSWSNTTQIAF